MTGRSAVAGALLILVLAACGTSVRSPRGSGPDTSDLNAPSPTPTPPASPTLRPGQKYAAYTQPARIWSLEYPARWYVSDWRASGAAFTSYDPATAQFERPASFESALAIVPPTEIRIHVEMWPNDVGASLSDYVDAWLAPPFQAHGKVTSRSSMVINSQPAVVLEVTEALVSGTTRNAVWVFVALPGSTRVFLIRMFPAESVQRAEFDRMLATFRIF